MFPPLNRHNPKGGLRGRKCSVTQNVQNVLHEHRKTFNERRYPSIIW